MGRGPLGGGEPGRAALDRLVPEGVAADWPLERPRCVGRDHIQAQWMELPDLG